MKADTRGQLLPRTAFPRQLGKLAYHPLPQATSLSAGKGSVLEVTANATHF